MIILSRVLVGLAGILFIGIGAGLWFNTADASNNLGLTELAAAGFGTVRADIGGFFIGGGLLQLLAATQKNRDLLWPVQLLLALAFTGRAVTLVMDGPIAAGLPSMAIELVLLALLAWCQRLWAPKGF